MPTYKTHGELEFTIDYDFQPEEAMVMYPNDRAYPGAAAEVCINSIDVCDTDVLEFIDPDILEFLKAEIMEYENTPPEDR